MSNPKSYNASLQNMISDPKFKSKEFSKLLLIHIAGGNNINRDFAFDTLLTFAVEHRNSVAVQILLQYGASTDESNYCGSTPLTLAVRFGYFEIVEILLKYGANVNLPDCDGLTPLMEVNERGFAQFLIENGADLNCIDDAGNTALHIATNCNNIEIVQILLDKGAKTDLKNVNNMTALDIAKIYNRVEIFKLLSN